MSFTLTLEHTIEAVKEECRNWFNEHNSPDDPPVENSTYKRFLILCDEIHAFRESSAGKESPYVSESVFGSFSKERAVNASGMPVGWQEVFSKRLQPYKKMFTGTGR